MRRFLAYEAYVANNEIMKQDASTSRMLPTWPTYEHGVEALAASTTSINHREVNSRKALSFADLLIKVGTIFTVQGNVLIIIRTASQFSTSANTHCSSYNFAKRPQLVMTLWHMKSCKRFSLDLRKQPKRSTKRRTIQRRVN
jgi:hypothetical protein